MKIVIQGLPGSSNLNFEEMRVELANALTIDSRDPSAIYISKGDLLPSDTGGCVRVEISQVDSASPKDLGRLSDAVLKIFRDRNIVLSDVDFFVPEVL